MPDIPVAPSPLIEIREADLSNPVDGAALLALMELYARDPMCGGQGLSDFTRAHLIDALASRPSAHVILALAAQEPAGLLIGLEGFSTFACRPLLNIHDLVVAEAFRRQGGGPATAAAGRGDRPAARLLQAHPGSAGRQQGCPGRLRTCGV